MVKFNCSYFPQILSVVTAVAVARPEPPRARLQIPQAPPLRQQLPRQNYGAPPPPSDNYGDNEEI